VPPELLHEIYSELALQKILEIEWQLEAQNPDRAEAFRQELAELVAQLLIFPESAPVVGERKQVRKRLFKRFGYGLLYVIQEKYLLITLIYPLGQSTPFWDDYMQ
jgi:plasmid stabilization system protein ParE